MPREKNTALRIAVPLVALALGIGIAFSVYRGTRSTPGAPAPTPSGAPASGPQAPQAPTGSPTPEPGTRPVQIPAPQGLTLAPRTFEPGTLPTLGGLDPKSQWMADVGFSGNGAGFSNLRLADHFTTIKEDEHVDLQREASITLVGQVPEYLTPFSSLAIEVTPAGEKAQMLALVGDATAPVWQATRVGDDVVFQASIVDGKGAEVLRLSRRYSLAKGSYDLRVAQTIENLAPYSLSVRWFQLGPVDPPQDAARYGGDKRRVRFGYLLDPSSDPTRGVVVSSNFVTWRRDVLGKAGPDGAFTDVTLWPNDTSTKKQYELVWLGMTNRHYAVAMHPLCSAAATGAAKTLAWVQSVHKVVLNAGAGSEVLGVRVESTPLALTPAGGPGASADLSFGVYAGPQDTTLLGSDTLLSSLGLPGLVVYNFGGPCGICTFDFLTSGMLDLLHFLHDHLFHDWTLSIMLMVLLVRSLLHPVTKWSQIRMARWGKQMAAIGPKVKIIQEKFKNDPARLQQETSKLWREEGVSPAGALGCIPGFIQSPVWLAVSAMLYFAVELRHAPGLYGVFQAIQPRNWPTWTFLGDLSEPDRFFSFGHTVFTLPMLGPIESINLLPIVLGIVFFIQQKYLAPPTTTTTLTPEQEMQQKMMKWMMVFMFPVMMYNAPSGLAIYFLTNSTLAIIESKWIRAHMDRYGLLDIDKMKAERLKRQQDQRPGFFQRLQSAAEQAQKRTGGRGR